MAIVDHFIVDGTSLSILDLINQAYNQLYTSTPAADGSKVVAFNGAGEILAQAYGKLSGSGASLSGTIYELFLYDFRSGGNTEVSVSLGLRPTDATLISALFDTSHTLAFDAGTIASLLLARSDDISGTDVADQLLGFDGNDFITAGAGDDFAFGGNDNDHILGSAGLDSLAGAAGDDFLDGGEDADNLDGGPGDDTLLGRAGTDTLNGGAGGDVIVGGHGIDTVRFVAASKVNLLNPGQNGGEAKGDEYSSVEIFSFDSGNDGFVGGSGSETVLGGLGKDDLRGGGGSDFLRGEGGDDTLGGGDGKDTLRGGLGNDTIIGDAGADTIEGEGGRDTLRGGVANDRMTGGTGADRFVFAGEVGADTITDFARGTDKLAVSKSGFGFTNLRLIANANPVATANAATFLFDTDNGLLRYDDDGTGGGAAALVAVLQNLHSLATGDFALLA